MIIAHDLGTTGDKASLHDARGRLVAAVTVAYDTHYGTGGVVEQDPRAWWEAVAAATRRLLEQTGTAPAAVSAVGLSGQMMGAVLLDSAYEPVRPALIWADTRSRAQCARVASVVGDDRAYALTGHRLNPTYTLHKVAWVRENEPDVFARVAHVCMAKDFVVHRLTGRLVTDPSDASGTNAYDQTTGTWSAELIGAAGVDPALFPEIVPSTAVVGGVTAAAAAETGLRAGTPVVAGGGDGPLAAVGAGVVSPADGAYAYLGSSSWISLAADAPLLDPGRRTMTFDHVVPGRYVPTATMQAGGGSLAWISEVLRPGADGDRFRSLVAGAATAEASGEGLYFLPYLLGERSPYWNPEVRGAFAGISRHHGPAHLTRAVLEGVAFNLYTCLLAFRDAGASVTSVDAIGGGASGDVWLAILADVWGVPVRRRTIAEEANSLGAAVTAGVGTGVLDSFAVAGTLSEVTAEFLPDPSAHEAYVRRHAVFVDAYERLEPWHTTARDAQ